MLKNAFTGRSRGTGVRSGIICIPKKFSSMVCRSGYHRIFGTIVFSVVLSGCVATALTPPANVGAPALSLNQQNSETDIATGKPALSGDETPQIAGITVPVQKPGSETPAPQLALADTDTTTAAAKQAEKLASTPPKPENASPPVAPAPTAVEPVKAKQEKPAGKSFFASLFTNNKKPTTQRRRTASRKRAADPSRNRKVAVFKPTGRGNLPGVRKLGLFGIYDSREGAEEGYGNQILVASAGGLARTSANGLRSQHAGVQVACLRPGLVRIIKQVPRRYGRVPIVTSGYRSPKHNRRVRGARNSMHIYCKAADIQVAGVSKWALAKYLRTVPGRGGVGTYCHTNSVHIDTGSKRDWNWRCRRGRKRAKRRRKRS